MLLTGDAAGEPAAPIHVKEPQQAQSPGRWLINSADGSQVRGLKGIAKALNEKSLLTTRDLLMETDKAERRREPGAWVQAQQVPWTTGLKKAENSRTIDPSHVLANDHKKRLSTEDRLPVWSKYLTRAAVVSE
jgi:hypothetical protein